MSSADMEGTDIRKVAIEVVRVLHENKIPIVLAQLVFKETMELIERNTIPYSPKAFSTSVVKSNKKGSPHMGCAFNGSIPSGHGSQGGE